MRKFLLPMLLLSTSLLATGALDHNDDHLGSASHSGTGKVNHDGDFIEFTINFDAACYAARESSWDYVSQNISSFLQWLDEERYATGEDLSYSVEPINLWRNDNIYGSDPCNGTYYATQSVKLTYNKAVGAASLYADAIQDFYSRLQSAVWPLSHIEVGDVPARVTTNIINIEKGLYEETADNLRIAAKAKAQDKATQDFLAFLGADYQGVWYLQSVDFRERDYSLNYRTSVEAYPAPAVPGGVGGGGGLPAPALLKLKPITISLTGDFHFVFDVRYWHMN